MELFITECVGEVILSEMREDVYNMIKVLFMFNLTMQLLYMWATPNMHGYIHTKCYGFFSLSQQLDIGN